MTLKQVWTWEVEQIWFVSDYLQSICQQFPINLFLLMICLQSRDWPWLSARLCQQTCILLLPFPADCTRLKLAKENKGHKWMERKRTSHLAIEPQSTGSTEFMSPKLLGSFSLLPRTGAQTITKTDKPKIYFPYLVVNNALIRQL